MRTLLTCLTALALATPMAAQNTVLQAPEGRGLALVTSSAGHYLQDPTGSTTVIDIPAGTQLGAFRELADGWIAAGYRWTDTGNELVLVRGSKPDDGRIERLEPPEQGSDTLRIAPVPLIGSGRLIGLAWLEGDGGERNAVMAASFDGSSWGAATTVAPFSENGQLALRGTVLEDGTGLLVWSAVVEQDSEILWSRSNLDEVDSWSPPARMHSDNDVPDITPQVAATASGALVAWSQYDGKDYRLRISHFDDGEWLDTGFRGEEASLLPTVFPVEEGVGLTVQTGSPPFWSLLEVSSDGSVRGRVSLERQAGATRPIALGMDSRTLSVAFAAATAAETALDQPVVHTLEWTTPP